MTGAKARLRQAWDRQLSGTPGRVGVDLRSLDGPVLARDADRQHYAASTIKLAVLATLLQSQVGAWPAVGIPVHSQFPSVAGGSFEVRMADDQDDPTWSHQGSELDLGRLAERMITVSGNLATDLILEYLGLDEVNRFLDRAGLGEAIAVDRLIGDDAAEAAGVTNRVSADGLARLMAGIADHSLLGEVASRTALEVLARQEHRRMIPAGLPPGTWSASKGGWVTGVAHDVALVRPSAAPPYVLAICTTTGLDDTDGEALVARLSAVTWEHWRTWHAW